MINKTIVLVGLMGAGKTTIARLLSQKLGVQFVDSDKEIEKAAGCRVADIFDLYGEEAFRDVERRVISRLLKDSPHVLALGGGAFINFNTRQEISSKAISVWLKADLDVLLARTSLRSHRPILQNTDAQSMLSRLIVERYPIYSQADYIFHNNNYSKNQAVCDIISKLNLLPIEAN